MAGFHKLFVNLDANNKWFELNYLQIIWSNTYIILKTCKLFIGLSELLDMHTQVQPKGT